MARYNLRFLSKYLLRRTEVNLIIPSLELHGAISQKDDCYYRSSTERFPLIIAMSGFGDDNEAWLRNTDVAALCDKYRVAVAMISGENKWYLDVSPTDNWHSFISKELPDFLFGNFSRLDPERLMLAGVSMGGYGALYNGLKNPGNYKAILSLSPALKPDGYIDEQKMGTLKELFLAAKDKLPYLYLAIGSEDFIFQQSTAMDEWLKENIPGVQYRVVAGYGHVWSLWALELENFLQELKSKQLI